MRVIEHDISPMRCLAGGLAEKEELIQVPSSFPLFSWHMNLLISSLFSLTKYHAFLEFASLDRGMRRKLFDDLSK